MKQSTIDIYRAVFWVSLAMLVHMLALVLGALFSAVYATLIAVPFVLLGLWVLCRVQRKPMESTLHVTRFPIILTTLAFVMGFAVYASISCIVSYTFLNDLSPEVTENIEAMFGQTPFPLLVCSTAIAAPLIEELTFRGFVYEILEKTIFAMWREKADAQKRSAVIAVVLQAVLFGAFHMNLQQFVYASVLGLLFGLLRYQTDSIWPGVFAHIGFNFFSVGFYKILQMRDTWPLANAIAEAPDWALLATTLPVFLVSFVLFEYLCKREKHLRITSQIPENLL